MGNNMWFHMPSGAGGGQMAYPSNVPMAYPSSGPMAYPSGSGGSCSVGGDSGGGGGLCDACKPGEFYLLPDPNWGGAGCTPGWLAFGGGPCATPIWPQE